MSNPAAELHEIFVSWRDAAGATNAQRRAMTSESGLLGSIRAMVLIDAIRSEIDDLAAAGRRVGPYEAAFKSWAEAVLCLRTGWDGRSEGASELPDHPMDVLEQLADILEHLPRPQLNRTAVQVLQGRLKDVLEALDEDESLDARLRTHIRRAVRHVETCVDEFETYGESKTAEALETVWVGIRAAEAVSSEPARWSKLRDTLFMPTAAGLIAGMPQLVAQITAGG